MAVLGYKNLNFSFLEVFVQLGILLLFVVIFFLIRFINRKNFLSGLNSYVLLLFAVLFGIFPKTLELQNIFIAHFFLLLFFRRVYSIRTNKNIKQKLFDSGFWIAVASIFYIWCMLFLILVYIAILVNDKKQTRHLIIPLVGFATPYFILLTYYIFTDNFDVFLDYLVFKYSLDFGGYLQLNVLFPAIFLLIISVWGILKVSTNIFSLTNDLKPSWLLIITHFIIALYIAIFAVEKNGSSFIFTFFPIAIIIANYLQILELKISKEIVIYSLLILSISIYFL
ncbi:DUF6427 family protein [Urechidicola croceus]